MSLTVKRNGTDILVLEGAQTLPEGIAVQLFTEDELQALAYERSAMFNLQMPSFFRGDEDVEASELFFL